MTQKATEKPVTAQAQLTLTEETGLTQEKIEEVAKALPEIINKEQHANVNLFSSKDGFEHTQRVAVMLSKSDLVPKQFQGPTNVGNCIIALEMSVRVGASPLMIMQNLYIVHGKPAWSSSFLIATVNACGKFSPLRYEENPEKGCRAWAVDKNDGEKLYGVWVNMAMAKAEGWSTKTGSKWVTMPELMMRYRAATFFARQFAPELSMGISTQEEVIDIGYTEVKGNSEGAKAAMKEKFNELTGSK